MANIEDVFAAMEQLENFISLKRGDVFDNARALIDTLYPTGVRGPVQIDEIDELETSLSMTFPSDYHQFLRIYGFAMWFGGTVFGIPPVSGSNVESYNDSVLDNTMYKKKQDVELRNILIDSAVIGRDDFGGYFVLYSQTLGNEHAVEHIVKEGRWIAIEQWISFTDYLSFSVQNSK